MSQFQTQSLGLDSFVASASSANTHRREDSTLSSRSHHLRHTTTVRFRVRGGTQLHRRRLHRQCNAQWQIYISNARIRRPTTRFVRPASTRVRSEGKANVLVRLNGSAMAAIDQQMAADPDDESLLDMVPSLRLRVWLGGRDSDGIWRDWNSGLCKSGVWGFTG